MAGAYHETEREAATGRGPGSGSSNNTKSVFFAAVNDELRAYQVDETDFALTLLSMSRMPDAVQYVWPHPRLPFLYVAFSNRFTEKGSNHGVAICQRDPEDGRITEIRQVLRLSNRSVHLTVDSDGRYLLIAYNAPSDLTAYRLGEDGSVGEVIPPSEPLDTGIYAHQARVAPGGEAVILPTRGNDATAETTEDPGSIKVFHLSSEGVLSNAYSVAPGQGYGFGPRHVDFHPSGRWMYVSIERQNQLMMFPMEQDLPALKPFAVLPTLRNHPESPIVQLAGPIHIHPKGHAVYVSNRSGGVVVRNEQRVFAGGEDSIAVFRIDPDTGLPLLIQSADLHLLHCRTFSIHPNGRLLVAASVRPILVEKAGRLRLVEPSHSVFGIEDDGRLTFIRNYEVTTAGRMQFWTGMVAI